MRYNYTNTVAHMRFGQKKLLVMLGGVLMLLSIYVAVVTIFNSASFSPTPVQQSVEFAPYTPNYPTYGSAGVAVAGVNVSLTSNDQQRPMASTAKLVTALTILATLKDKDIKNEYFTITEADVSLTKAYQAKDGSIAAAPLGARVSYYDALQYMLVLSANNFTDIMIQKVFNTPEQYTQAATAYLKSNGIENTVITDATGFAPSTISTAHDMLRIGNLAVSSTIITDITRQQSVVDLNGATQKSTNLFLPNPNGEVIGLKTGFTDEAKAVFLNATRLPNGTTIIAVSMGATTPLASQTDTNTLATSIATTIKPGELFAANEPITAIALPWGGSATVYAKDAVSVQNAADQNVTYTIRFDAINKYTKNGNAVGSLSVKSVLEEKSYQIYIDNYQSAPLMWRLFHF